MENAESDSPVPPTASARPTEARLTTVSLGHPLRVVDVKVVRVASAAQTAGPELSPVILPQAHAGDLTSK